MSLPPEPEIHWDVEHPAGWVHVLPPLAGLRLLCVTPHDAVAAQLARACMQLTRLHLEIVPPAAAADRSIEHLALARFLASSDVAPFDGLVLHDPEGLLLHQASLPLLAPLLLQARRRLAPGGFVYLGVANRTLRRKRAAPGGEGGACHRPVSPARLQRLMRSAGVDGIERHPFLMYGSRVAQVLPPSGYRSTKNRELLRERVKEWLLGPWGARLLAPACALVGGMGQAAPSTIALLVQHAARRHGMASSPRLVLKEYLILGGHKAILSIGAPGEDRHDVVAVLAGEPLAVQRRHEEAHFLDTLSGLSPELATRIPKVLDRFPIAGSMCFLLERMPGVTLDQDVRSLEAVTQEALGFLIRLHRETAKYTRVDEKVFDERALKLLEAACARNPRVAENLRACAAPLKALLFGLTLPLVWMHGDFKVENVMYDFLTRNLTAVIDWEHASVNGLPVLDLLYLQVFNRTIRGSDWISATDRLLVRAEPTAEERAAMQRYIAELGIPSAAMPGLALLFVAHHIGCRMHLPDAPQMWMQLNELIDGLRSRLQAPPQQAPQRST